MSAAALGRFLLVALTSAVATALLARLAPRLGWTDVPDAARKAQRRPVPAVGGVVLLLGLAWTPLAGWSAPRTALWGPWLPAPAWGAAALGLVLLVGTWDDRFPLPPGRKVVAQLVALAPLAAGAGLATGPLAACGLLLVGVALLNLLNTFDNADGALASLCAVGFAPAAPLVSAACLGFLPLNLDAARRRNRPSGAPSAYLGDAGAFVLAFLVLWTPASAGLVVLPALDLARLAHVRWRAGSRPWIGDRRHLAHRLAARGLARPVVAGTQCLLALPACSGVAHALQQDAPWAALAGPALTAALYVLALRAAPERPGAGAAVPCPPRGGSE